MPEAPESRPALWVLERGRASIHLFGGRAPLPMPWRAPGIERALEDSEELWNETPPVSRDTQRLALDHGIDPSAPLDDWLTPEDRRRVDVVAAEVGLDGAVLAPMRPWLASQVLSMASESRRGIDRATASPEAVLCARAEARGIPIRHEFPTPDAIVSFFSALPREAEVEMLRITIDDLQADPARDRERAEAWLEGDLALEEAHSRTVRSRYPAFYRLNVVRNEAWVSRLATLLNHGTRAFVVVGIGHLTGPESLLEQIERAGLTAVRLTDR